MGWGVATSPLFKTVVDIPLFSMWSIAFFVPLTIKPYIKYKTITRTYIVQSTLFFVVAFCYSKFTTAVELMHFGLRGICNDRIMELLLLWRKAASSCLPQN